MLRDVVGMIGFQVHVLLGVDHHVNLMDSLVNSVM